MTRKSDLYKLLKESGVTHFEKPYVQYTEAEFEQMYFAQLSTNTADSGGDPDEAAARELPASVARPTSPVPARPPVPDSALYAGDPIPADIPPVSRPQRGNRAPERVSELSTQDELMAVVVSKLQEGTLVEGQTIRYRGREVPVNNTPAERAGLTYNLPEEDPVRIDTFGRIWYMDEVPKPSIPKARMTRKSRYIDPGVQTVTEYNENGMIEDIFEVAGDEHRELTTTVTLPSWQVGKYRDARFPFMIHVYNGASGFDYREVMKYFGGRDLVPGTCKTRYVGNQLCYDITSTRETIESQFRLLTK